MRYVFYDRVTEVSEKQLTVGGKRSADGRAELFVESAGWYVRIGNFAFYLGDLKPEFVQGQVVKVSLEAVVEQKVQM